MPGPVLVTGGHGFAGRHLVERLRDDGHVVSAPPRSELDLRDLPATCDRIGAEQPEQIFHLAALASVGRSWEDPRGAILDNQEMTLNLLEAARRRAPAARILYASSGEIYGPPDSLPVTEEAPLRPQSPYAVSKAGGELLATMYATSHGQHVVCTRAFNHAGPGQSEAYVIGTLTRQVAEAEAAGATEVVLRTGNPDSRRDFSDVRDVVAAYALAVGLEPGVYNVASERSVSVRDLVDAISDLTSLDVTHEIDPARVRARDVPEVRGSAQKLRTAAGWAPRIPLTQTLADALGHWRARTSVRSG